MLSEAVAHLSPSATLAITARAKFLAARGEKVVSLAAGQPDFDTPRVIKDAAKAALDAGFTKYTPSSGIPQLKKAICKKLKNENGLTYKPEQILVSNGAKQALFIAMFCLVNKGDEVLLPAPYWVSYPEMVKAAGGRVVVLESGGDFKINVALLRKKLSSKTKVFVFNAPSNPTGVMYSSRELAEIAAVLRQRKIWVFLSTISIILIPWWG
jgi:aspartate aminotransferase